MFGAALCASVLLYHRLWADPTGRTIGLYRHFADNLQTMWFLKWVPWRLVHGHNPFSTTAIDYPGGVDLAWNTSTPTLGILFAPLTALAGAAVTYAVLMTLAPVLATTTGFLWLRRHVQRPIAAAVGAFVIGFGPFMASHLHGHLHLVFIGLLPVVLMLTEDLLWRRPRPQHRTALFLGITAAVQLGISEETLLILALAAAIAAVCWAVGDPRGTWAALRDAAKPAGLAIAVALALAAPLLVEQFVVAGTVHMNNARWVATPSDYVTHNANQLGSVTSIGQPHAPGGSEIVVYIGWTLLAVLALGVVMSARQRATRVAAVTLGVLALLTFGDIHWLGVPLPWHYLQKLPGFGAVLPVRIALGSAFCIAFLLAREVDQLIALARADTLRQRALGIVGIAAVVGALNSILPGPMNVAPLPKTPAFLSAAHPELPAGSPIVLLPSATPGVATAMYWQQQTGFRFRMLGGYAYDDHGRLWPDQTPLVRVAEGRTTRPEDVAAAREQLAREHYRAVVVVLDRESDSTTWLSVARVLTGREPDRLEGGVALWLL